MPEWKQLITHPAGALPPNMIRTAGIVFFSVVLVGLVLSTMWTSGPENAGDVLPGTEPNLTGPGHVAQLSTRLTDLQDEQQRAQARAAEQAQREAEATQALTSLLTQGGGSLDVAGVGGVNQGLPATGAGARHGEPGMVLTPDEIDLRERLRLEDVERLARSLRTPAMVQTIRPAPVLGAVSPGAAQSDTGTGAADPATPPAPVAAAFDPLAVLDQITDAASTAARGERPGRTVTVGADRPGCDGASHHAPGRCGHADNAHRSGGVGAGL